MKKFVCLLLALATALSLAACGAKPSEAPAASSAPEGEKIHLLMGVNGRSNVTDFENNALTRWIEEVTGFDIDVQVFSSDMSERVTQVTTMVTGGEPLPDVMYYFALNTDVQNAFGNDGYLYDMAKFIDDDAFMAKLAEKYDFDWKGTIEKYGEEDIKRRYLTETRDAEGHIWSFPSIGTSFTDQPRNMLFINKNWLDKLGLEMPHTLDELEHVLTEFITKDPNGNGQPDEMGLVGSVNVARGDIPSWLINNFIYLNDTYMFNCDDEGKVYLPYDRDEYREGLRACKRFYDKGLIAQMTWTIKEPNELPGLFTPADEVAKIGVWAGHPQLRVTTDNPVLFEYTGLLPLDGAYAAVEPMSISMNCHISGESEHPEAAFEVLYALATPEGQRRQRYGEKDVDWEWADCIPECGVCHGKGTYGDGKALKILNNDAYSGQTSSTFANYGVGMGWVKDPDVPAHDSRPVPPTHGVKEPDDGVVTWAEYRSDMAKYHALGYLEKAAENNPKNMVFKVVYTAEELEKLDNSKSDILSYAKEMRAKFITGEANVDDDAAWKTYVDTIHSLGWDTAIECTQSAYDRMNAQ